MKNNTLIIGLYYQNQHSALLASVALSAAEVQTGALSYHGFGLASALHNALIQVQPIGAKHLIIFCNHKGLVEAFTRPIRLALPDERKEGRKKIPCGNDNQWAVARDLCRYQSWTMSYTENLPNSKQLWEQHYGQ